MYTCCSGQLECDAREIPDGDEYVADAEPLGEGPLRARRDAALRHPRTRHHLAFDRTQICRQTGDDALELFFVSPISVGTPYTTA